MARYLAREENAFLLKAPAAGGSGAGLIPTESALDLDARATTGSVTIDAAIAVNGEEAEKLVVGEINGGGPLLLLRTSRGRIHLSRR